VTRVAVVLYGYGEVDDPTVPGALERYNELSLRYLVTKSVSIPARLHPIMARRLARRVAKEWADAGDFRSPHNAFFERQRAGIATHLQERYGDDVGVYTSHVFLDGMLPAEVLAQVRADGFDAVLHYPLLVVDSVYTGGLALEQVNESLNGDGWPHAKRYLPGFSRTEAYRDRLASLVDEVAGEYLGRYSASQVGVVLVNHGCPMSGRGWETGRQESEELFRGVYERVATRWPLTSVGWLNHPTPGKWTEPAAEVAARHLVTLGARVLVFVPIGFVTDNHETILDVEAIGAELRDTRLHRSPALNDDPAFLEMAAGWAVPLIEQLRAETPRQPVKGAGTSAAASRQVAGLS
jgi:protoporphyrin/coproporphyrin ferrochelatase